jgi:AhpC/TSA family
MLKLRYWMSVAALASLVAAGTVARAEDEAPGLKLGATAPAMDIKMLGVDGKQVAIEDLPTAKGRLVIFTCNACPWAKAWETRIVTLGNTWSKKGVGVIAINSNDPAVAADDGYDTMKARAQQRGMKYAYVVDETSEVAREFGATRTPEAYVFDADGKLVYHGAIDDNAHEPSKVKARYLDDAMKAMTAGKTVATAETKALGCSIKFRKKESS